ncbi:MAG: biotin/lipoyl-binding carrier protein [Pseudomonadota bacterium]
MARQEITSDVTGTVWKIERSEGDKLEEGDVVMILESMKMEIPVEIETAGTLKEITVAAGDSVEEGAVLCIIET